MTTASTPTVRVHVRRLALRRDRLVVDVEATSGGSPVTALRLVARARGAGAEPVVLASRPTHRGVLEGDLSLLAADLDPGRVLVERLVDVAVEVGLDDGTSVRRPVPMPGWRARGRVRDGRTAPSSTGPVTLVLPYFSADARPRLVLRLETRSRADQAHLDRLLRVAWALGPARLVAGVWLVGEQPQKAQDNGYHLFRWIRTHEPRRRAYYVVAADSPDRARVEPLGHVVVHGSRRHQWLTLLASRFLATHHAEYLFASRSRRMVRHARGLRVALRHGILGTKDMTPLYGQPSRGYRTDLMLTSSRRERSIVVQDLGYRPGQVHVTGMPRLDALLTDVPEPDPVVLVAPTWRDWLQHEDRFVDSEFLRRWLDVLADPVLRASLDDHGLRLAVLLHPNMRGYTHHLDVPGVRLLHQGEVEVQDLLRRSAVLVTDYSSVGFDFSFLGRPVVYYQFDRARFLGPRGSHLDLDAHLPGPVAHTHDALVRLVRERIDDAGAVAPEMLARSAAFLEHHDTASSRRVVAVASQRRPAFLGARRLSRGPAAAALRRRWRAHRSYRPTMRALFAVGRLLPRRDVTVLETDTGHGFGDAPRALHAELVRRGAGGRLVWSVRTGRRLPDPAVERVERGTPRWFWELSRARTWVVNQNLPHELRRPRGTTYVQTWHGTPLKRMQHDAHAQDPAYLARTAAATRQWSVLLSPSPWATTRFRTAFRYDGPVVEEGSPRNDALVTGRHDGRVGAALRARWGLEGRTVVLYAPTFRDGRTRDPLPLDVAALVALLPDDWSVLVRPHPLVRSPAVPDDLLDRVRDVRDHPDGHELLLVADLLVTDYSSLLFDAPVAGVPVVLHAPDLERYRDDERGFYLDLDDPADRPGPLVRTVEETAQALLRLRQDPDEEVLERFRARFAPLDDGAASHRVVDALQQRWKGAVP